MTPIQQMMLGIGAEEKTYLNDVFNNNLYIGSGSSNNTITNGMDMSGKGGMVWIKNRGSTYKHRIFDTVRGTNKSILAAATDAEATVNNSLTTFNSNGYVVGTSDEVSDPNTPHAAWAFRQAPGFFAIKEYTGSGSTQQIAHDLGCIPGSIWIKRTEGVANWGCYHRGQNSGVDPEDYRLRLNSSTSENNDTYWGDTAPTATHFTVGDAHAEVNNSGSTYIAYIFAGGASTAATARCVEFDGSGDYLDLGSTSSYKFGSGDFTVEAWVKPQSTNTTLNCVCTLTDSFQIFHTGGAGDERFHTYLHNGSSYFMELNTGNNTAPKTDEWYHIAYTRSGNTFRLFLNGCLRATGSSSDSISDGGQNHTIGMRNGSNQAFTGKISNFRVVKGTAVYTSSFKPSTAPLTDVTNTTLLCCNNSSVTGKTVGSSISSSGNPTASTDSPFDDPAAFVFGDNKDQTLIKTGRYKGIGRNGGSYSGGGPEFYLGWEPQFLIIKGSGGEDWLMFDNMRGWPDDDDAAIGGRDQYLRCNSNNAESGNTNWLRITQTGFQLYEDNNAVQEDGYNYTYIAIRRPDGYVSKPADAGTDVFAMDAGNNSSTIPAFDSGFPVDFAMYREPAQTSNWWVTMRLMGKERIIANTAHHEVPDNDNKWDSNAGWRKSLSSAYQSWMWKKGPGLDTAIWMGDGVDGRGIAHGLNAVPEMIWVKKLDNDNTDHWIVYHDQLNGGTNPEQYYLWMDVWNKQDSTSVYWFSTPPNSTHFTVGNGNAVNHLNKQFMGVFFSSVSGISKVGSYTGSSSTVTVTTGFQPRFVLIKRADTSNEPWIVLDTTRGWGSGNDAFLQLNEDAQQNSNMDLGAPTSTGFTVTTTYNTINTNGGNFLYYAHA